MPDTAPDIVRDMEPGMEPDRQATKLAPAIQATVRRGTPVNRAEPKPD